MIDLFVLGFNHDYEVPEISFYFISNGNTEFLNWIDEYTSK